MATHSSVLVWSIPGSAEPGGLPSLGSHRVRHDWSDLAAAVYFCSTLSFELNQTVSNPTCIVFMTMFVAFLMSEMVRNLPAMQETWVWSLGREDTLEKGMAIHSSILAWRIPWTEDPGGLYSPWGRRVRHDWVTNTLLFCLILMKGCALSKARVWQLGGSHNLSFDKIAGFYGLFCFSVM